ncbi:MAG: serine hydrolase [Planctomycetes bacterium]|nr:serine hydrolase [Planctomycetota bacterium]
MRFPIRIPLHAGVLLATAALVGGARAQDDRDTDTPTGAIWVNGQTVAQLTTQVNAGWRITDLEYDSIANGTFTAALVRNSGAYSKTWWWYVGATGAQIASALSTNNARLIDLEPYDDNGTTRFAAIMIRNTGADAKAWWWVYDATSANVNNAVSSNNARLTDLERYSVSGTDRFAAIMISNTGADARGWAYWYSVSQASIAGLLNQNNLRPYSMERNSSGTYDLIGIQNTGYYHWYYFNQSASSVTALLEQNVGRIIDIERYTSLLTGTRYDVVMIDNANDLERRAWLQFDGSTDGAFGAWLKEIGGPILAQVRPDFVFEPASLMKTLYHTHAMRRVALGLDSLSASVTVPLGTVGSCPNNSGASTTETLEVVLRRMMENSDNNRTLAIANRYGVANINATAAAIGMASTSVNHVIGCGGPIPNELTLRDVGTLHETVANGYLLAQRDKFYELMPDTLAFPTWGSTNLSTRIDAEAATLGLPNWVRDAFKAAIVIAYKPGGYGVNGLLYFSEGGFLRVPFKDGSGNITLREYSFGSFNHGASVEVPSRDAVSNAALELVWDRVRAGLATWNNLTSGSISSFGTSCAGSAGSPLHTATGTPLMGASVSYNLSNAPALAPCVLAIGFSNTAWAGGRLPVSLDFLGATGCFLRIDPLVTEGYTASSGGTKSRTFLFQTDPALIGFSLYTQYTVLDRSANPAGFTTTNGVRTRVGGYR